MPEFEHTAENTVINDAIQLATIAHRGQIRKDGMKLPYIVHPMEVMMLLLQNGVTQNLILAAAVLHDVVEDTGIDLDAIARIVHPEVARLVQAVTKPEGSESADGHAALMDQICAFDEKWNFGEGGERGNPAAVVKIADRLSNIGGKWPSKWSDKKIKTYLDEAMETANLEPNVLISEALKMMTRARKVSYE